MRALLLAAALIAAAPVGRAHGWPCPHGQLYRVSLGQCFSNGSRMARAYALAPQSIRARGRRIAVMLPRSPPPPPPPRPIPLPSLTDIRWGGEADDETRGRLILRVVLKQKEEERER